MRRAWPLLLWVALARCGPGDLVLSLPPELPAGGAVLFVVVPEEGEVEIHAQPSDAARLEFTTPREERVRVTALSYEASLGALGLEAGRLARVDPSVCGAQPLPPQDSLHEVTIAPGDEPSWSEISVRSDAIDAIRLPGACPCAQFEVVMRKRAPLRVAALWTDGPDEAVLLDGRGAFWRMTADLAFTPRVGTATAPVDNLRAVETAPDGRIWLSLDEALWRGTMQDGFTRVPIEESSKIRALAGGVGEAGFELFGTNEAGELWRYEPGPPQRWARPRHVPFIPTQVGRVVWRGPGEVIASEHAAYDVFWMKDRIETGRVELPPDSGGSSILRDVPGVGLVALTTSARLFRLDEDLVQALDDAPVVTPPRTMLPFRGGLLYTGNTGYLQEYQPDYGFCPTQQLEGEPRVLGLIPLGARLVVIALDADPGGEQQVILLEPIP